MENKSQTCPPHDTRDGRNLTREEQFELDFQNQARWALMPRTRERYREFWERLHKAC